MCINLAIQPGDPGQPRLDRDHDGVVTAHELLTACSDPEVRRALQWTFPDSCLEEPLVRAGGKRFSEKRRKWKSWENPTEWRFLAGKFMELNGWLSSNDGGNHLKMCV
jgi:hypothetical protein